MTREAALHAPGQAVAPAPQWLRTNPLAMVIAAIQAVKNAVLPMIAIMFGSGIESQGLGIAGLLFLAIVGLQVLAAWLGWRRLRYRVGQSDIKVEKGLISRSARSVPFERIQDVSLEQGFIPRLLGLVEVRFETGAGGKDELKLAYVSMDEGERLREVVRDQRDAEPALAPNTPDAAISQPAGEMLFSMGPKRLALFGMFQFSLVVFAVLAGLAQQFNFLIDFDIWSARRWGQLLGGPGHWLEELGWIARIIGIVIALGLLALTGIATGIVRTFLRDWDFRLERTAKGFRRRRGLLTRTDVVMPVHRVQAVTLSTGYLRRIWGWHGLSFISLAQDAKSANHVVAPFAQMEEIRPIVNAAEFDLPGDDIGWHRPASNYWTDKAILAAAPITLAAMAVMVLADPVWIGLGLFGLAGFAVVRQYYLWRVERHAVDGRQILSRRGWLSPRLKLASRVKLHSVEISQGPIAKWRGYADLNFGLAGGTLSFHGLPLAAAEEMRAAVMSSIAAVDFARLPA